MPSDMHPNMSFKLKKCNIPLISTLHVLFVARYGRSLPGTRGESMTWPEDPAPSPRRGWFLRSPCRSPTVGKGAIGNAGLGESRAYRAACLTTCAKSSKVSAIDLDGMTVQQLTALIAAAETKRREKLDEAKAALRAEMERKAAELGISAGELFPPAAQQAATEPGRRARKPRSDTGAKRAVAVRYRGPNGEKWSGRGRTPRWLAALEAEGKDRKAFAVAPEPELGLA